MTPTRPTALRISIAVYLAAVTIAAHWPAIRGEFLLDDVGEIAANPAIRTLWPPLTPMFQGGSLPHRPIPYLSFALNYALHGLDSFGYHAVNIVIHLLNGWLVWTIVRCLLGSDPRIAPVHAERAAWAATAAWLLHPLTTQAVDYVYQRIELLGATGILATVACFLNATRSPRPTPWLATSIVACGLAMLCKETAVAAPLAVLLVDWLGDTRWRGHPWRGLAATLAGRRIYYTCLAATLLVAVWVVAVQRDRFSEFDGLTIPASVYAANQPLVIVDYLRLSLWPANLCLDRYRMPSRDTAAMIAAGLAATATVAAALAVAGTRPLITLAILLFFALLAPTSSIIAVNDLQVDHRMYLPLAVLLTAVAAAGSRRLPQATFIAVTTACCLLLACATHARAAVFASRLAMWQDVVEKAPLNPRGWAILADEHLLADDLSAALVAIDQSVFIEPFAPRAHVMRARVLERMGRAQEAAEACLLALRLDPSNREAFAILNRLRGPAGQPRPPADSHRPADAAD
jgi:hypothetical protein